MRDEHVSESSETPKRVKHTQIIVQAAGETALPEVLVTAAGYPSAILV